MVIAAEFATKIARLRESQADCLLNCFQMSHFIVPVFERPRYVDRLWLSGFGGLNRVEKLQVIKHPKIPSNRSV